MTYTDFIFEGLFETAQLNPFLPLSEINSVVSWNGFDEGDDNYLSFGKTDGERISDILKIFAFLTIDFDLVHTKTPDVVNDFEEYEKIVKSSLSGISLNSIEAQIIMSDFGLRFKGTKNYLGLIVPKHIHEIFAFVDGRPAYFEPA
jgi:hypothetical protein